MTAVNRLPAPAGMSLERSRAVSFRFEGRSYEGLAGDTVASALAANDVWLLSRSFKYHRPRGVLTMAGQDANTLVQLPGEPNVLADRHPVTEGLEVSGQHYRGSLAKDRDAWIGRAARFLPVGFYYRAFYRPGNAWKFWEPIVRRRAGLGRVDTSVAGGYYDKQYLFCDVAIVGGGAAGMAAALEAAQAGADVLLVEENTALGGALSWARFDAGAERGRRVREDLVTRVGAHDRIRVMTDAVCNGWFADNWLPVIRGNRMYKVRARQVVLAPGSIEQPAVFGNNDLPGIMLGSAAQRLIGLYGVRPGRRAVVLTASSYGYGVALDLRGAGVDVAGVVDMREQSAEHELVEAVRAADVRVVAGSTVYEAGARSDGRHLGYVTVRRIAGQGKCSGAGERIDCDLLCMSPGYVPTYQLALQAGARLDYHDELAEFSITGQPDAMALAGSVNGVHDLDAVLADGRQAGRAAAQRLGLEVSPAGAGQGPKSATAREAVNFPWPIFPHPKGKEFVDFDEDLRIADIVNACADGYDHLELVKRFSTVGMGPSQGRHSALTTARLVARASGRTVAETGVTTARPPFSAEKLGNLAGRRFDPVRHTAMHHRHAEAGAQWLYAGLWLRPAFYGSPAERLRCMQDESRNVRENVGLVDVSTLGGLEVRGADAPEFMNRMYTFSFLKQQVGRTRYVVMTNEHGVVIDDGVACRLAEDHYYVTATTGGVEAVYRNMLLWNAQWRLDVDVSHVTSAWAGVNIAGPESRRVLEQVCDDVDLSAEAFPYMGVRTGSVAGVPARIMRVGFVGELGYEVHVPSAQGEALWDALIEAGRSSSMRPFGIEAQRLLRLEKGHIIIGQDTDAMSVPREVHLAWAVSRKKPFFVGGRSIEAIDRRPLERQLVGFTVEDSGAPVPEESHLVIRETDITGRVTSCYFSPTMGRAIGLAYVAPDQAQAGSAIRIRVDSGRIIEARVTELPFYDPDNARQEL